ncbi:C2 domain-containing protein [Baffinella frigidus]|nr:C2 domain-containing protein [Cryptophyta sp. CCMP2293]
MGGGKGLDPPEPSGEVKGSRRVQLYAFAVSHLPSMDLMGKCDPFVRAVFGSEVHETSVIKNTYDASFEESFVLDVVSYDDEPDALVADVTVRVLDHDLVSASDEVGAVSIPGDVLKRAALADLGWEAEVQFDVLSRGRHVVGHDRKRCVIRMKVRVLEGLVGLDPPGAEELAAAGEWRRVRVTVVRVQHLPSMDVWGKCDPFCRLVFAGQHGATGWKKSTYDAVFDETFDFDLQVPPPGEAAPPLEIQVMDHDVVSAADLVGTVIVSARLMTHVTCTNVGWEVKP